MLHANHYDNNRDRETVQLRDRSRVAIRKALIIVAAAIPFFVAKERAVVKVWRRQALHWRVLGKKATQVGELRCWMSASTADGQLRIGSGDSVTVRPMAGLSTIQP